MPKILVVDDSLSMRKMVIFTLQECNCTTTEAENGQIALEKAQNESFDLVITDLNMPIMDGLSLIRRLRSLAAYKFIPILVLTTEKDPLKKEETLAAGATGWLSKPFSPEKLLQTINKIIEL